MRKCHSRSIETARLFPALAALVVFFLCEGFLTVLLAQQSVTSATLSGQVTDPSGAVIVGAQVTARQTETNLTNTATTDQEGRFRFPYLRVGPYEIKIHQEGFADAVKIMTVTVGAAFELPLQLSVAPSETDLTVTGEAAVLEAARSQIEGTVSKAEVSNLPLNGRNFLDLTLLVPGVSPTNTASTQLFPETSAVPGQGISISSQRNFSNSFIVDGLSSNDDAAGLVGTFYGLDVVQEFQVVTSGGQAEYGRALGGYINMVTKSGTNSVHGDVYGYLRNQRLNAANPLTNSTVPLTQAQYGASLGGPIVRDRTFYFANFEQRSLNQVGIITISPANASAVNARLVAAGYQGSQITTGLFPNPVHNSNFLAKLDHQFNDHDQFSFRYSLYDVDSNNSRGAGGLSSASAAAGLNDFDQTLAASNVRTISPVTVNETRAQFTYSGLKAPANDAVGPAVSISGVASFGTLSGSPTGRLDRLYEIVDNFSHRMGSHAFRTGVDFLYNDLTITYPRSIRGSYAFSSLNNFLNGTYSTFTQTFGKPLIQQTNPNVGFYAQDEWKVNSRMTLNAGLRYDLQFLKSIATDTNNFSPRAGFAWTPFASGHTVLRGGFGVYYDRVPLRALANALLSARNTSNLALVQQQSESLSFGQTGAPAFPNILSTVPPGILISITTMNPQMQNAYADQGNIEVEQQLGKRGTLSVGYQHLRGLHLIASVNQNVPACGSAVDPRNLCRPNPSYQNNSQYSPVADSQYDGLHVSFVQRPTRWGAFRVSYTFSKAYDDVSEFFFSGPMNLFNIHQDWGRSDDDQRHRLVFDGSIHTSMDAANTLWRRFSNGFQLSGAVQYYSALPFNITTGGNTIQTTAARPCASGASAAACAALLQGAVIARNAGVGFAFFNVNARISRIFPITERMRLEALAEAFNVFNHRNNLIPVGTFGSGAYPTNPNANFGQPTAVADPRQIQFGLRVNF